MKRKAKKETKFSWADLRKSAKKAVKKIGSPKGQRSEEMTYMKRTMEIMESFESTSDAEVLRATTQYLGLVFGGLDLSGVEMDEIATPGSETTAIASIFVGDQYDEYVSAAEGELPDGASEQEVADKAVDLLMTDMEETLNAYAEADPYIMGWDWIEPPKDDNGSNLWIVIRFDSEGLKPFGADLESEEEV